MQLRSALAALILASLPLGAAAALEAPEIIRPTWGVVVEGLLDPAANSMIASPSINFNFGCGFIMPFSKGSPFSFEPSADLYWANYEYLNKRAVPTDLTFGTAFGLGLLLDAPVVVTLPLGNTLSFGLGAGVCLDLRAAFTVDSAHADNPPEINRYFWEKGRFATPSTLIRAEYKLTERVAFGFNGRVLWPIYNLWTNEGYGFFDRAMYLIDLSIRYKLPKAEAQK